MSTTVTRQFLAASMAAALCLPAFAQKAPPAPPSCQAAKASLHQAFDQSELARATGVLSVDSSDFKDFGLEAGLRTCGAVMRMSNATQARVVYTLIARFDSTFVLTIQAIR